MAKNKKFFILNGVRRAVAAREAGRKTVAAAIFREGRKPERRARMRLDQLYSSKHTIDADERYARIDLPVVEPITVEPLGSRGQQTAIPLADVVLL